MMGRTHALTGALGGLGLCQLTEATGTPVGALQAIVIVAVTAGAAMWPDLDHPHSTVARALGPVTWLLAHVLAQISGGHRNGTHSLVGVGAAALVTVGAGLTGTVVLTVWLVFLIAVGSWALIPHSAGGIVAHTVVCLVLGVAAVTTALVSLPSLGLMVAAVAAGTAIHIAGDMVTVEGCPLLWPAKPRIGLPLLTTAGPVERLVITPVTGLVVVGGAWIQLRTTLPAELQHLAAELVHTLTAWSP